VIVLYGLEAIRANNGWAMAFAGALIVMGGLTILAFVISQLHKILLFWENRKNYFKKNKISAPTETGKLEEPTVPDRLPSNGPETEIYFTHLVENLDQPFQLVDLYKLLKEKGFPHPHLTLKEFQLKNVLVPCGEGFFTWNPQTEK
jgi:hypothetical protein